MKIRARVYSILAGCGFLAYVILSLMLSVNVSGGGISLDGQQMSWMAIGLAFAVMYFVGKRQVGLLVVSGLAFLQDLTDFASDFREASMFAPETMSTAVTDILEALAFAALFAMFLISISAKLQKKPRVAGIFGIAALTLSVISDCVYWLGVITNSLAEGASIAQLIRLVPYMCISLSVFGSSVFAVLWIVLEMKMLRVEQAPQPVAPQENVPRPVVPQAPQPIVPVASSAGTQTENPESVEKAAKSLSIYKELLDNGLITQEDYDIKKRQILGL